MPSDPYLDYITNRAQTIPAFIAPPPLPSNPIVPIPPPPIPRVMQGFGNTIIALPPPVNTQPKKRINVRSKGQRGEREVIGILQAIVDRVRAKYAMQPLLLQRNTIQAHVGGEDIFGLSGFAIEVKFQELAYSPAWWTQCLAQASKRNNAFPILFYRASRQQWTVKMRAYVNSPLDRDQVQMDIVTSLDDFMTWFEEAYDENVVDEMQRLK